MVVENNEISRNRLAQEVVDSWDMGDLIEYAVNQLEEHYATDNDGFQEDWINTIGED